MLSKKRRISLALLGAGMVLMWMPTWAMSSDQENLAGAPKEETASDNGVMEKWGLNFSAAVEVEAAYADDDRESGASSDIALATVEIGVDAAPVKHVSAHVVFLFEEGDTDPIDVDQGYIRLDGEDQVPFYLSVGRQYLPFGGFNSHFISDPLTLELGETRESSLIVGYGKDGLDMTLGIFNGEVQEDDQDDDHINGYTAGVVFTPKTSDAFGLTVGLSYISNIGESDGLQGEDGIDVDAGGTIDSPVAGVAAFVAVQAMERLFLEVEYVAALDEFKAGELAFGNGQAVQPVTYNVELSCQISDQLAAGVRLAGAQEGGEFLPEVQYGAVVNYDLMEGVSLGLEYQQSEFDTPDDKQLSTVTAQLGLAF